MTFKQACKAAAQLSKANCCEVWVVAEYDGCFETATEYELDTYFFNYKTEAYFIDGVRHFQESV